MLEIAKALSNPKEANAYLQSQAIDGEFVDIQDSQHFEEITSEGSNNPPV
jgi:hypothetical protein